MRSSLIFILAIGLMTSCIRKPKETVQPIDTATLVDQHQVKVLEVLQANQYTYLRVAENGSDYWVAVTKLDAKEGENYYYKGAMEMKNFKSKDLDREFESVLFISEFSDVPIAEKGSMMGMDPHAHAGKKSVEVKDDIDIAPAEGGISIADLYNSKSDYSGKKVLVRGKVVKVNKGIMSRNWVHIQDGSGDESHYDLTVTTQADVNVNDIVTFEGIVAIDKDFGAGYFYDLIVEEAELK
ncbi:GW dipeptide domain-containing protein [Sunxiuqinia sp. A32]|uniref:GW dipeptide domain-containing protein n=1 Tax=Sunxiuqinia sp. A32 TaxID=3461496 RepID=UPI004045FA56